ncbi:MAG: TonB-dependent receptor [Rhodothermaceae bacterium]|nr:MAG: TonB-dependent receptor [Rhodothermaceae bacterium]
MLPRIRPFARLIVLLMVLCPVTARPGDTMGQPREGEAYSLVFRGTPLDQALEALVRLTRIDLVYSTEQVAGRRVYCTGRELPAEALLRCVLAGSGLDYVRSSSGAYVLIEARNAPALFGDLAGQVIDGETGVPLPAANVLLAEAATGTTTNDAGFFSFAGLVSGPYRVVVTYVGYETARDSVWVAPGARARLQVRLRPRTVPMHPIVIDGLSQRLPSRMLGSGEAGPQALASVTFAGTPDVARGAGRLPGVAATQPLADLHIQGGGGGEHLTRLDGIPVRHPVSLGRHLGAFSPLALRRLVVHKAGFGVEHGSHLAGLVAAEHHVNGEHRLAVSLDPISANARTHARLTLPGKRPMDLMFAGRTGLWAQYQDPGVAALLRRWNSVDPQLAGRWLGQPVTTRSFAVLHPLPDVAFSDLHAALRLTPAAFHLIDASAYHARNRIRADLTGLNRLENTTEDRLILTRDDYDWSNWMGQARYSRLLGAHAVLTVQAGGSRHTSRYSYRALQTNVLRGTYTDDNLEQARNRFEEALQTSYVTYEHNAIREVTVRAVLSHSLAPSRQFEAGLFASHTDSEFNLNNQFIPAFWYHGSAWTGGTYLKGTLAPGWHLTLEPGLRLTYAARRRTVYAEPRLALRYDRETGPLGPYALRLATGLYRQFVNQFELTSSGPTAAVPSVPFWLPIDRTLAPPRTYHLAAEALLMPSTAWTIRVEGYYKAQPRLLTIDYATLVKLLEAGPRTPLPQATFIASTHGRAFGGSLRVVYTTPRLTAGLDYAFSRAVRRYPGRFDDRLVPVPWNVPHRLTADLKVSLSDHLSLHLTGEGARGRRWALRQAYYDYLALGGLLPDAGPFDLDRPDDHRLPAYLRLDAGLAYTHTLGPVSLQAQFYLVNLTNHRNVYDQSLETTGTTVRTVDRLLPGRYPVFAIHLDY